VERCPSCRGRLNETTLCPRCGCDLGLALRAESQAQNRIRLAIQAWAAGNTTLAATRLDAALTLQRSTLAAVLVAMLRKAAGVSNAS